MNQIEDLQKQVAELKHIIDFLVAQDRYIFKRDIEFFDGKNIRLSKTTGTKIGTLGGASGQKIGFFGAVPVVQQTGVAVSAAGIHAALVNLGLITS